MSILVPRIMNSSVYGLKGRPTWEPTYSDASSSQHPILARSGLPNDNSPANLKLIEKIAKLVKGGGILEIGVSLYDIAHSFTPRILRHKPKHVPYLGVDIEDKKYLDNEEELVYTLKTDSFNQGIVRSKLLEIGITELDLLVIDGSHSLNMVINDWQYADLLSKDGIIVMHDTNSWLGPVGLVEAIDTDMFNCVKLCRKDDDYGMSIIRRRHE